MEKWTGDFGLEWEELEKKVSYVMKQNTKYVGMSGKGGGGESYLLNGNYFPRILPDNIDNLDLIFGDYDRIAEIKSGPMDNIFSSANPHGSIFRVCWGGNKFSNLSYTDIVQNGSSGSQSGIPYYLNLTGNLRLRFTKSQEFEGFCYKDFLKSDVRIGDEDITSSLYNDNYGYTATPEGKVTTNYVVLPLIKNNQIIYGGDGAGVLDNPIVMSYNYRGLKYNANDPMRYCYADVQYANGKYTLQRVYWILTYLKNNVVELTPSSMDASYYGHFTFPKNIPF